MHDLQKLSKITIQAAWKKIREIDCAIAVDPINLNLRYVRNREKQNLPLLSQPTTWGWSLQFLWTCWIFSRGTRYPKIFPIRSQVSPSVFYRNQKNKRRDSQRWSSRLLPWFLAARTGAPHRQAGKWAATGLPLNQQNLPCDTFGPMKKTHRGWLSNRYRVWLQMGRLGGHVCRIISI